MRIQAVPISSLRLLCHHQPSRDLPAGCPCLIPHILDMVPGCPRGDAASPLLSPHLFLSLASLHLSMVDRRLWGSSPICWRHLEVARRPPDLYHFIHVFCNFHPDCPNYNFTIFVYSVRTSVLEASLLWCAVFGGIFSISAQGSRIKTLRAKCNL